MVVLTELSANIFIFIWGFCSKRTKTYAKARYRQHDIRHDFVGNGAPGLKNHGEKQNHAHCLRQPRVGVRAASQKATSMGILIKDTEAIIIPMNPPMWWSTAPNLPNEGFRLEMRGKLN